MGTTSVSSSDYWITPTSTTDSSTSTATGTSDIGNFETFLQLLAVELQNQDPTDPVSNTEYVSQIAQMNSLSQLQSISTSMDAYKAYAMIGKTVSYTTTASDGTSTASSGTVSSVIIDDDDVYLYVNSTKVSVDDVTQVSDATTSSTTATA